MKIGKKELFEMITDLGLGDMFFNIIAEFSKGKIERNYDESYSGGFWDFTYELGFTCDTDENEREFERIYNMLWEIAENMVGNN